MKLLRHTLFDKRASLRIISRKHSITLRRQRKTSETSVFVLQRQRAQQPTSFSSCHLLSFDYFGPSNPQKWYRFFSSKSRSILFAALEDDEDDDGSKVEKEVASDAVETKKEEKESLQANETNDGKEATPLFDRRQSPIWHLQHHYLVHHNITISTKNHFQSEIVRFRLREGGGIETAWTSKFKSPLDGVEFPSGTLFVKHPRRHPNLPFNKVVYSRRSDADHAAAARALDYIQFRANGLLEPRHCVEYPSHKNTNYFSWLKQHYKEAHNVEISLSNYVVSLRKTPKPKPRTGWTATFKCPITAKEFSAKSARISKTPICIVNGEAYFSRTGQAVQAVSSQVLDSLSDYPWEVSSTSNHPTRSVPVSATSDDKSRDDKSHASIPRSTEALSMSIFSEATDTDDESSSDDHDESSSDDDDDIASNSLEEQQATDDDDEDYEVNHSVREFLEVSPALQLLQVASNANSSPPLDLDVAINTARSFAMLNAPRYFSPHRLTVENTRDPSLFLRGKNVLKMLASAVQVTPIGHALDSKKTSLSVLRRMRDSEASQPDTECYNLCLKCVDTADPQISIRIAERFITSMGSRRQYAKPGASPHPNRDTMNALIQITAQLGGSAGRHTPFIDVDRFLPDRISFLSVLSSATYDAWEDGDSGGFDPEFAGDCIERMSELSQENTDSTLKPDVEVYNAPLRWTGGPVLWRRSRPYARYIPWDDYKHLYRKGFTESPGDDHLGTRNARLIHDWVLNMERLSLDNPEIRPNIETYEAAIQAWLRTATREGLAQAEGLLKKIIAEDGVRPRLQTFHPILGALTHFVDPKSNVKLLEILELWKNLADKEGISCDLRLVELELFTLWDMHCRMNKDDDTNRFEVHTSSGQKKTADEKKREVFAAALRSTDIVSKAQGQERLPGEAFIPEIRLLELSMRLWRSVVSSGDKEQISRAVSEAEKAVSKVEKVFAPFTGAGWSKKEKISSELEHCLSKGHIIFITCSYLLEDACRRCPLDAELGRDSLVLLERMVRLTREMEVIEQNIVGDDSESLEQKGTYESLADDLFDYELQSQPIDRLSKAHLLKPILMFFQEGLATHLKENDLFFDAIRICHLCRAIWPEHPRRAELDGILRQASPQWCILIENDQRKFPERDDETHSASAPRQRRRRRNSRRGKSEDNQSSTDN